jgi:mannose-1-phosphate guanylyltransferase
MRTFQFDYLVIQNRMAFHVVIMAGGGGTRLWPASRKQRPKQFLPILPKGETLIGATAARLTGVVPPERLYVVIATSVARVPYSSASSRYKRTFVGASVILWR